jgi:outer membrane protein TolC
MIVCLSVATGWVAVVRPAPPPTARQDRRAADTHKAVDGNGCITSDELEAWRALNLTAEKQAPAGVTNRSPHSQIIPRRPAATQSAVRAPSRPNQVRVSRGYLAQRPRQQYVPLDNWNAAQKNGVTRNAEARPDPNGMTRSLANGAEPAGRNGIHGRVMPISHLGVAPVDEDSAPPPPPPPEELPPATGAPDASEAALEPPPAGSAVPEPDRYDVIDLPASWRLALSANPQLGGAREALNEALALRRGANAIALPNLNAGFMYHLHNGTLQASFGQIRQLNESSLYVGGGDRTLAAETLAVPAIQFFHHLGDVIYEPLAARQQVVVRRFDATDTANSVLLDVSLLYLDLVSAEAQLDAIRQTEIEMYGIARITRAYANSGQGRDADADRAYVEALLVHTVVQRAEERVAVASARLAQLLNLDPSVRLRTAAGPLPALQIVDPMVPLATLLQEARGRHPLLASRNAAIDIANTRLRQEQTRPFLPLVSVGMSAGGFGGTGNFPPQSQFMQLPFTNLQNRADFDVIAVWTLQNLGIGNVSTIRQRRAVRDQSVGESSRALNQIRDEVAESYAQAQAQLQKIRIARRQLDEAEDGYAKDLRRLENAEVEHPIEVVNLVELVSTGRQDLIQAIIGYNQAQFRLFVATGLSPLRAAQSVEQAPPGIDVIGPGRNTKELSPPPPPPNDPEPLPPPPKEEDLVPP